MSKTKLFFLIFFLSGLGIFMESVYTIDERDIASSMQIVRSRRRDK